MNERKRERHSNLERNLVQREWNWTRKAAACVVRSPERYVLSFVAFRAKSAVKTSRRTEEKRWATVLCAQSNIVDTWLKKLTRTGNRLRW